MNALEEALKIVTGDRQKDYDHPSRNFQRIADLWNGYSKAKDWGITFNTEDVAMLMVLAKIGRQAYKHKQDNLVDIAGYIACLDRIINKW